MVWAACWILWEEQSHHIMIIIVPLGVPPSLPGTASSFDLPQSIETMQSPGLSHESITIWWFGSDQYPFPYLRSCEEHLTKMVESNVRSIQEQGARMLPTTWFGICSIQRNSILWMDQLADEQRIESLTTLELRDSMQYAFSSLIWFQRYRRKEQLHT